MIAWAVPELRGDTNRLISQDFMFCLPEIGTPT
jgi:hypothetical protein